jgi:hypothetical protein
MKTETKGESFIGRIFKLRKLDEDGSSTDFENSYAKTDTPVKTFDSVIYPSTLTEGLIKRIHYRLNPTNAVTFTLRLYSAPSAADYASNCFLLYESPPLQANDIDYDRAELDIPFRLGAQGLMYYAIEWTGAPGTTKGFIDVSGVVLK